MAHSKYVSQCDGEGEFWADLLSCPVNYGRLSKRKPGFKRCNLLHCFPEGRALLPLEIINAQGINVWPHLHGGRNCSYPIGVLQELPSTTLTAIGGNGLHGPSAVSFVAFILATLVSRTVTLPADLGIPGSQDADCGSSNGKVDSDSEASHISSAHSGEDDLHTLVHEPLEFIESIVGPVQAADSQVELDLDFSFPNF